MPENKDYVKEISSMIERVEAVKTDLGALQTDPDFVSFSNRPIITMLMTGCDFLTRNFSELKKSYRQRTIES